MKLSKKISVCIPVYRTERFLKECLKSVSEQTFKDIEIVVLSDASDGKDDAGLSAKKIVKLFQKTTSFPVRYLENSKILCLVEVRRALVSQAQGEYIFMLDSDDILPPMALESLYKNAVENTADIVQGDCTTVGPDGKTPVKIDFEYHALQGVIKDNDIFNKCFIENEYRPIIAAKLIRTEIYRKAFEQIPFIYAHMAEEVIQYFFIARIAKIYSGIQEPVYLYRQGSGITGRKITTLDEWEKVCSAASIITALYDWADNQKNTRNSPSKEEMTSLQHLAKSYCINNVKQFNWSVAEDIKTAAHKMLCDYWGEDAVKRTEDFLNSGG